MMLAAVVVLVTAPACTDSGQEAYDRGDYATALKEWRPLAEQGNAGVQFGLGAMYEMGLGVLQDYKEALRWYRLAAEQGNPMHQTMLGFSYLEGKIVPEDYILAHMWLSLAAAQGYEPAQKRRDSLARQMTHAQIAEAQRLAREWTPKE